MLVSRSDLGASPGGRRWVIRDDMGGDPRLFQTRVCWCCWARLPDSADRLYHSVKASGLSLQVSLYK